MRGYGTFLTAVFADAVKRVDVYVQQIVIGINQTDHLLCFAVHLHFFQSGVFANAVVNVGNINRRALGRAVLSG
jgi:hypothetical protein